MSFIRKLIGPDEKFIGIGRIHWIYAAKGFAWIFGLMGGAYFINQVLNDFAGNFRPVDIIGDYLFWMAAILGGVLSVCYFLMWIATEIGLTNKRIIYKRGLIFVDVKEVDLEEIKAAEVDNGMLGSILNYGYVFFDARFIENVSLPAMADPYRFVKALNEARSGLKQDSMKIVLEGQGEKEVEIAPSSKVQQSSQKPVEEPEVHKLEEARYATDALKPVSVPFIEIPSIQEKRRVQKPNVIVFPRSIQEKKEMLRRKVKSTFTRNTQKVKS